jgi:hypothetical protein
MHHMLLAAVVVIQVKQGVVQLLTCTVGRSRNGAASSRTPDDLGREVVDCYLESSGTQVARTVGISLADFAQIMQ